MTWLEFKLKVKETTLRMSSEAVPITFIHGDREISPDDIMVCCEETGDKLALIIVLKEGEIK
jgi:hypothetical protein